MALAERPMPTSSQLYQNTRGILHTKFLCLSVCASVLHFWLADFALWDELAATPALIEDDFALADELATIPP